MSVWNDLSTRIRALMTYVLQPGRVISEKEPEMARIWARTATQAGVNITPDTALKTAAVWACVTYLGRTVGQLPWRVMQELPDGREERRPTHPVDYLLRRRPNAEMGAFAFREVMVGWACRWGNAVAEIQRDARGVPVALWPIHPSRVEFDRDENGTLVYDITGLGPELRLRPEQVFHLRGFGEGPIGLNVIAYAAESIGWAQATELFGASYFGNGINPTIGIEMPTKLSPEALAILREDLAKIYGGPRNAHRAFVADGGMKLHKLSGDAEDAQFVDTRQHQIEEICRWFGVPPHKAMHLLRATFSNIEHQSIEVVVDSITPWCKRLEEEASYKLFGNNRNGYYTHLDINGLQRGDFKSRQEGLAVQRRNGVINVNEWRRLEGMNEIGEIGNKYIVEGNMTTLDRVGEAPAPAAAAPAADDPEDDPLPPLERARQQLQRTVH